MSRAYGWNARMLIGFETTYGVTPIPDDFFQVPFTSNDLDSSQGLIESNVLGLGRDPTEPFQDVINVDGDIVVPVDLRNIGFWLKAIFGDPTTTGAGPYVHEYESGAAILPSLSTEKGMPEIPDYPMFTGVRANSIAFNFARSGEAQTTISLIGQSETPQNATFVNNPEQLDYTKFSQFQGSIKQGGATLANVTSASLNYSNNLERIETTRDDGKIDGVDPGVASLSGTIDVRYADTTLMDAARSGTPIDLEFAYKIDGDRSLVLTCHRVFLPKPKRSISGPGGIEASYDYQGSKDPALGKMLTATLTNDVETY